MCSDRPHSSTSPIRGSGNGSGSGPGLRRGTSARVRLAPLAELLPATVRHGTDWVGPAALGLVCHAVRGHDYAMLTILLIVVVLLLLFGGGGFFYRGRSRL